jgi:hypothetical protein
LCASGELFVKLIVTVPAFAVSDDFVNFSAPDGSAAIESELIALLDDDVAGVLDVADELAAVLLAGGLVALLVLLVLLLLLLEPPQALTPSTSAAAASASLDVLSTSHIS